MWSCVLYEISEAEGRTGVQQKSLPQKSPDDEYRCVGECGSVVGSLVARPTTVAERHRAPFTVPVAGTKGCLGFVVVAGLVPPAS